MKANDKSTVPQKGTGSAGESLAVARPPNNGGRATGRPPYSGEGPTSLGAMHHRQPHAMLKRTPTTTSQMTQPDNPRTSTDSPLTTPPADRLTKTDNPHMSPNPSAHLASISNAAATPAPPVIQSAWTQVVPRHKRKKPKKRKKTNRRTDSPTGKRVDQPTQEPVSNVTATSVTQTRGSRGQSGNEHRPSAETVASGLAEQTAAACQPGTSGGQSADTRKVHLPTSKHVHNPAQRGSHSVAHRSNAYWRRRSRGGTHVATGDPGPSTSHSTHKRDRLDDTISPRGEHKKRRTDRPTHGAGSYAQASQPNLNVAVALMPRTNMTQTEAGDIQGQIEKEIFNACLLQSTPGTASYAPAFEGRAFLSEGVLKLWCTDDQALDWLQKAIPRLKSPREGTALTLIRQLDIPTKVRSALFVPNYDGDVGKLHLVLTCQNPWYKITTWTLYTFKRVQGRTPGLFLVLGIPREQIDNILARGRKVAYSTGSIYIRFFTKEGVSDVPPKEAPQPEMKNTIDVQTVTTPVETSTIPPLGESSTGSPDSSVSTVLEEIESVLTEENVMPPTSPQNKSNWDEATGTITKETAALTLQELLETWAPKADM